MSTNQYKFDFKGEPTKAESNQPMFTSAKVIIRSSELEQFANNETKSINAVALKKHILEYVNEHGYNIGSCEVKFSATAKKMVTSGEERDKFVYFLRT